MTSALKSWWPLATAGGATAGAGGAAPTEELEDLDAILQEPGADADLPVSSSSGCGALDEHAGRIQQQRQQQHQQQAAADAAAGSWSSYVPGMTAWLPSMLAGSKEALPPALYEQQQHAAAGLQHHLPSKLDGAATSAAGSAPVSSETPWGSTASSLTAAAGSVAAAAGSAAGSAADAAAAWVAAAQHQLSWACEHATSTTVGVSVVGAAVGGLVAGPLGVAVGAKSGAAMVAAGALGGAAVKAAKDRHSSSGSGLPPLQGAAADREMQPLGQPADGGHTSKAPSAATSDQT